MYNHSSFRIANSFGSISQSLHHSSQCKDVSAIKKVHAHLLRTGLIFDWFVLQSQLIYAYTTCLNKNKLETLTHCFQFINPANPFVFNTLISDFCRNGFSFFALKAFSFMHINRVPLDSYALCSSLTASSSVKDTSFGRQIHAHVAKSGWLRSLFVGSALIDLYAKASLVNDAAVVFDEIPVKNTVCANALLSGYIEAKLWDHGLELFRKMPALDLDYDNLTLSTILRACAGLSAIDLGMQVHAYVKRKVYMENDVFLQSSLIEMYGKCGFVRRALQVFNLSGFKPGGERYRDIVLWTSMLGVYGRNGHFTEVIELYKEMLKEGTRPDGVAFVTVISACAHTGQVKLGIEYFETMVREFKLKPCPEHYSCVIDLLCRAGELDKAWNLVNEMLAEGHEFSSISMWGTLLSACEEHGNVELGRLAAQMALKLEPDNVGIYVLLSNLYARFSMWHEIGRLREMMKERGLKKDVGFSWIP